MTQGHLRNYSLRKATKTLEVTDIKMIYLAFLNGHFAHALI